MKNLPLVSILIPTYNQPDYFRLALESAIAQDYPNIEIIVSDDSTDDRVKNVFDEYRDCGRMMRYMQHGKVYTDELVDMRASMNIENLLEHAQGEYVNVLLHDDVIYPQKISKMLSFFLGKGGDDIAIVSSVRDEVDESGRVVKIINDLNISFDQEDESYFSGEEVGRSVLLLCINFIGELTTVLMRRNDFYSQYVNKMSNKYFLGVADRTMGDIPIFMESCKNGRGLVFIGESLSAYRTGLNFQNTYDGTTRVNMAVDWLSFITTAYLHDVYIHTWSDFSFACKSWFLNIFSGIFSIPDKIKTLDIVVSSNLLDELIIAGESAKAGNYRMTLHVAVEWILRYSNSTTDIKHYVVKDSRGVWSKKED